jgi:hypothetical protein
VNVKGVTDLQQALDAFTAGEPVEYGWETGDVDDKGKPGTVASLYCCVRL